jgi:uncharacterized protein YjdB
MQLVPLPDRKVIWLSSDESVATVSDDGLVAAIGPGVMSVSALSEGVYASVTVRVSGPAGPVATVTVNPTAASLAIGETRQLSAILEDAEGDLATNRVVAWTSTAPNVASVSSSGMIQGLSVGTAIIGASSEGGRGSATIVVFDPRDAITVSVGDPVPGEIIGDTLTIVSFAKARNPIAKVHARVLSHETDLRLVPFGARGSILAWVGTLSMTAVHFGSQQLVITAFDDRGNQGIWTVPFTRGTRGGKGAKLPPRNK